MSKSKSRAPKSVDFDGIDPELAEWLATVPIGRLQWWSRELGEIAAERIACEAADVDMIDTGRPWPFHVTLEMHPFEQRLTAHVTVDAESGGMTPDEADTLAVTVGVARDVARSYAADASSWE